MRAPLGLLLAVSLLGGCAASGGTTSAGASASPSTSGPAASPVATSGAPSPAAAPSSKPAAEPTISLPPGLPKTTAAEPPLDAFTQVVTQGRVKISGACVELVTEKMMIWALFGPEAAKLRDGQQAKVAGVPDPNRESPCPGSPLLVQSVS